MAKERRYEDSEFFYGNLGKDSIPDEILSNVVSENPNFGYGTVFGYERNEKIRDCEISWLETKDINFIESGMRNIIHHVNDKLFKLPLVGEWESGIQVTKYSKIGHHYDWHPDYDERCQDNNELRLITLVYCLSHRDDYGGGELVLRKENPKTEIPFKFDYGDFIVFPSDRWHKVTPLTNGARMTLVGWYR